MNMKHKKFERIQNEKKKQLPNALFLNDKFKISKKINRLIMINYNKIAYNCR